MEQNPLMRLGLMLDDHLVGDSSSPVTPLTGLLPIRLVLQENPVDFCYRPVNQLVDPRNEQRETILLPINQHLKPQ